jgi:hypothetical protein
MNWLKKVPNSVRTASGLEWKLWHKLPVIAVLGTLIPLVGLGLVHGFADDPANAATQRMLHLADIVVIGVLVFHWTMVVTVGIGCIVVMVMKGPGYAADSYPVSHSDAPRATQETDAEAAARRPG